MSIDSLESAVESLLASIGIEHSEINGLIFIIICLFGSYVFLWYFITSIRCRKISCDRIDKTISSQARAEEAIAAIRDEIEELKLNEKLSHNSLIRDSDKASRILQEMDKNINQLHGIMLGNMSQSVTRRQIQHED
ncbi:MAG: hypothetical protein U9R12_03475 [Candidatus Caldatribacteriota bacterium]|nr:hypothetical protein [Candidatus Caldatribacteriota bacterium]